MPYSTAQARQRLLDEVAAAAERVEVALADLSEAFEALDEQSAERLESELFRPAQMALARAKRTNSSFAERHGLAAHHFERVLAGAPSSGVKGFLRDAAQAIAEADKKLAELQDSMLPVEVGDEDLRAALRDIRALLAELPGRASEMVRTFGR